MKEFVSETGGRYTYVDDILNLQDLSLSLASIFSGCSDFIISGCEVTGQDISSGYVWLNGKIRRFDGAFGVVFPYYIYETNSSTSVAYANETNKKGVNNFLCTGGQSIPEIPDSVTGKVPQFIKVDSTSAPRLSDKFFGKYSVLLDGPLSKQTIKKDVNVTGNFEADKQITSKTSMSVASQSTGSVLLASIKQSGSSNFAHQISGTIVCEMVLNSDGTISFFTGEKETMKLSETGAVLSRLESITINTSFLQIKGSSIINHKDNTDSGSVDINPSGLDGGSTRFRNFNVYDGKISTDPILQVVGSTRRVNTNGVLVVSNSGSGMVVKNKSKLKTDKTLTNSIKYTASNDDEIASIGYADTETFDFIIKNNIGDIVVHPLGSLNIKGALKINGTLISDIYATTNALSDGLRNKVDVAEGKQLSSNDFTNEYKNTIDKVVFGNFEYTDHLGAVQPFKDGLVTASQIKSELGKYASKTLSGYTDVEKTQIASNIGVYSKSDVDKDFSKLSGGLAGFVTKLTSENVTTDQAKSTLRGQIGAASTSDIDKCIKTDGKLADLVVETEEDKKAICSKLGAAYATEYQKSLYDSGWQRVTGTGKMTNNQIYARQIGNIVCIQGSFNSNNYELISGSNILCELPNGIQPPAHGVSWNKNEIASNDRNRGLHIVIDSKSTKFVLKENYGADNWNLNISITYMI